MEKAKQNIEKSYITIGLLEDIKHFLRLLERLVPKYFNNALTVYTKMCRVHFIIFMKYYNNFKCLIVFILVTGTKHEEKNNITPWKTTTGVNETAILNYNLRYDLELYEFIKKRFKDQLSKTLKVNGTDALQSQTKIKSV